ncbi:MAG: DUF2007 domain-containing protein [Candidatus Omnitrophica bacterium]|nr:DUF2007 domain-containing protein [Candidatus Omnitrophota bacterium]
MDEKWVAVSYPKTPAEAFIIKGLLESEGIPVFIQQEAIGKAYGMTLDGLGQIKILVPAERKDEAEQLLPK